MSDEPNDEAKKAPDDKAPGSGYTRRQFLLWAGAAGLTPILQQRQVRQKPEIKRITGLAAGQSFSISVLRPDDLLNLEFEFLNLKLAPSAPARLVRQNPSSPAFLIVHFPPQSIAEEAFWEAAKEFKPVSVPGSKFRVFQVQSTSDVPRVPPVLSRISGRSRLAFRVPDDIEEIPFTLESLLAWDLLEPSLVPVALPPVAFHGGILELRPMTAPSSGSGALVAAQPAAASAQPKAAQAAPTALAARAQTSRLGRQRVQAPPAKLRPVSVIPRIVQPGPTQTSIEMPYRLMLSPHAGEGWRHSIEAVTRDGRTELWHTRLTPSGPDGAPDESSTTPLHVRAVWSPDCNAGDHTKGPGHSDTPFRMSLDRQDRHEIVHLTSDYFLKKPDDRPLTPEPVDVRRLMLSPLGAWLDSQGLWEPPAPLTVQEWSHKATMARDHFVRVVYKGYLLPFGNQASLVKVTERKFWKREDGQQIAYLFQRMFIIVRRPDKAVPVPFQANDGRELPFREVRITTRVTPNLDQPDLSAVGAYGQSAFWPRVSGGDFPFQVVAKDWEGRPVEFEMPMLFVGNDLAFDLEKMKDVVSGYNGTTPKDRRKAACHGQKVAFAEARDRGDTSLEARSVSFGVKSAAGGQPKSFELADQPMCFPLMDEAEAFIPALKGLAGLDATRIEYPETYVSDGLGGANKGELFAKAVEPPTMSFTANRGDRSGGIASPSFAVAGLSRVLGPIGSASSAAAAAASSLADAAAGIFNPANIFDDSAKLLGGVLLKNIIGLVNDFTGSTDKALVIKTQTVEDKGTPVAVKTVMTWKPELHDFLIFLASRGGQPASLVIEATQVVPLDGSPPTFDTKGELRDFTLDLVAGIESFVRVMFSKFTFTAKTGQKADVSPEFAGLEFLGPLKFIKELLDQIQMPGGDGLGKPIVDVGASGAKLGFTFGIPTVAFGVFSLQNIRFTAEVDLPFNGDAVSLRFAFNERSSPFLLTVSFFGGGGFFAMVLRPDKIQLIEGSLEFGGSFALDIGVASGSVSLMAGIYFKYENKKVTLTGYVRCNGSLDVLGIISISAEFYLSLTYDEAKNSAYGQASLTVKIEVLFFSTSVTMTVEREFAHSPAPLFSDLMDQSHWLGYCEAFA
ncbi:MAG TPA: hypothetical protein VMS75_01965 [Terriglobales bacterium]|nr:hypothetical protein [Terriglobales bacterium]